jgi:L-alanine-DL-glutamate epimerase-like enolase superfamily enzyme
MNQYLSAPPNFMGSLVPGSLSAIDIALWDIEGKRAP